jgi:hypothetical protein
MYLHETYSNVRVVKYLSDTFKIQNGLKSERCFITIALENAIRKVHGNKKVWNRMVASASDHADDAWVKT